LLPLTGLASIVLILVATVGLGSGSPESGSSAREVAAYYDAHMVKAIVATFLFAAGVPLLVLFASTLSAFAAAHDEERSALWSRVLVIGTAVTAASLLLVAVLSFALADGADNGVAPTALQALNVVAADSWVAFNSGFGVMMIGAAGLLIPRAGLDRWFGWAALALGIVLFIPFADIAGLVGTLLWIVVRSVTLFRTGSSRGYAVSPGVA
jgi:hypothetical protein